MLGLIINREFSWVRNFLYKVKFTARLYKRTARNIFCCYVKISVNNELFFEYYCSVKFCSNFSHEVIVKVLVCLKYTLEY